MKPPGAGPIDKTLPAPDPAQVQVIRTYGPGHFLISDRDWREPVLVTPTGTMPWKVTRAEELSVAGLAMLKEMANPTELLLLGCGPRAVFVPPALRKDLKDFGLALEAMDTGSACRIYNVLLAEGRRIAAALIPL